MNALALAGLGLVLGAQLLAARPAGPTQGGNVVLIVIDDLGVDGLQLYGSPTAPPTPRIDELAAGGLVFRYAFANPMCSPTRALIQTGRHAFRTGVGGLVKEGAGALPLAEVTLPEMLDLGTGNAYAHAAIGKWHLGNTSVGGPLAPNMAGYGHFAGTPYGLGSYDAWTRIENGVATPVMQYATSAEVDAAIDWIGARSGPWFLYLALHAPHKPFHIPPYDLHSVPFAADGDLRNLTDARPYFEAAVEAMDTELGRLIDSLPPAILAQTTILLVGDNGTAGEVALPPLAPHKVKNSLYEGGIRVPLVVAGPHVVTPGREVLAPVQVTDLFATVADLAGVDLTQLNLPTLDSLSLVPYLIDPGQPALRKTVFAERFAPNGMQPTEVQRTIRNERYKLIVRDPGVSEFFDLWTDPLEEQPLTIASLTPVELENHGTLLRLLAGLLQSP